MKLLSEVRKYIKIYIMLFKCALMKQMEYRSNFFLMVFIESMFLITKLMYAFVVYSAGVEIYGLTPDMVILFIGTFILMTGIYLFLFYFNFSNISTLIREGGLDLYITKPISLQFLMTLRNVDFGTPVPNIIGGIVVICYEWGKIGIHTDFIHIAGYLILIVSGTLIGYSIMLIPQLISFFTIKSDALKEITDNMWDFNNMPMAIYNKWIQRIGVFIFPIFVISNFPALFALDKLNIGEYIWGLISSIALFIISRFIFKFCIKRYSSASS